MKTGRQIAIDKALGRPLVWCLNILVRLAGLVLRPKHDLDAKFKTIVICKFKGMGAILQATPLIQTLREAYPDAKIIFLSTTANRLILQRFGAIDEVVTINDKSLIKTMSSTASVVFKLAFRADLYIDLELYSNFSAIMTALVAARNRFGYYQRANQYRMGIYTHMMFFNSRTAISTTYLQFAELLNCATPYGDLLPPEIDASKVKYPDSFDLNSPYVVLNPNASDLRLERRWGTENFALLANKILEEEPTFHIVLIGGQGEREYTSTVLNQITPVLQKRVINTAGQTNLDTLCSIILHSKLVVTNDSGPMNLAFALKKQVVALFGPVHPQQYGTHKQCVAIYRNLYCSPCLHDFMQPPCKGNNQCMQQITVEEVLDAALAILHHRDSKGKEHDLLARGNEAFGLVHRS